MAELYSPTRFLRNRNNPTAMTGVLGQIQLNTYPSSLLWITVGTEKPAGCWSIC